MDIATIRGGTRLEMCSMPWPKYVATPGLNPSTIIDGRTSMRHLRYAWEAAGEDTDAKLFGRAQHCLLLEPREFEQRYWPWEGRRAGNAYVEFCVRAEAEGAEVIRAEGEYSAASAIAATAGFLAHPLVQRLVKAGSAEQALFADECGLQCKGRVDWISTSEHCLTDIKTAHNITARAFGRAFYSYGYDIKLGLYKRWLDRVTGERWPVTVICLENKAPYDVVVVPIPEAVMEQGADRGLAIIAKVRDCIDKNEWPGIASNEPYYLDVPIWEMDTEETVEFQG